MSSHAEKPAIPYNSTSFRLYPQGEGGKCRILYSPVPPRVGICRNILFFSKPLEGRGMLRGSCCVFRLPFRTRNTLYAPQTKKMTTAKSLTLSLCYLSFFGSFKRFA